MGARIKSAALAKQMRAMVDLSQTTYLRDEVLLRRVASVAEMMLVSMNDRGCSPGAVHELRELAHAAMCCLPTGTSALKATEMLRAGDTVPMSMVTFATGQVHALVVGCDVALEVF